MNGQEARGSGLQKTLLRQQLTASSLCRSSRDPRYIARKAETYLTSARIGDRAYFAPELERFVFYEVHYDQGVNYGYYEIDAVEANWKASQSRRFSHLVSRWPILAGGCDDPRAKLDCTITISACNTTSALSSIAAEPWP